jgi:uncharacterized damage-inducible protein DinB
MGTTTLGRPHAARLRGDLEEIRKELTNTVKNLAPEDLGWSPNTEAKMRTFKDLLQEIGAMEAVTLQMAAHGEELDWMSVVQDLDKENVTDILAGLSEIRTKTVAYLESVSEENLQTPIPLNEEWQGYFNAPEVEPEELIRWILRHEYYHLGQMITYQWYRGHNPNRNA